MTDNNIVAYPTPMNQLADKIRAAYDRAARGLSEWAEGMLDLGAALTEARDRFPSNQGFASWLAENSLDLLGADDRAALITMAREPEILFGILIEQAEVLHPDTLLRKYQVRYRKLPITASAPPVLQIEQKPTAEPEKTEIAPEQSAPVEPDSTEVRTRLMQLIAGRAEVLASAAAKPEEPRTTRPRRMLPRVAATAGHPWRLDKKPDADLVRGHVLSKIARTALADHVLTRGAAPLWELLIAAIVGGYYGEPVEGTRSPGLYMLLPWIGDSAFARSFDLREAHSRKDVKEIIFPLLDRMPELRLPENHKQIEGLVKIERRRIADERHAAAKLARHQNVVNAHNFAVGEQQIIAYGEPLWPQDSPRYTYQELCHACWYVKFWLGLAAAAKWTPTTTGMQGRHLIKYFEPVAPGAVLAVYDVLNAYQQNPDGETTIPTVPVNFGHGR